MKSYVIFTVMLILAMLAIGCSGPVTPTVVPTTVAPTQAPSPSTPQPTAMPTGVNPTPPPATPATPAEPTAYPAPEEAAPTAAYPAPEEAQPTAVAPSVAWAADGVIGAEEYANTTKIGPVTIWWNNDAEFLYIAAEARTKGWLSVGLAPENRMQGANYLFASFDGKAAMVDAYGTAPTGATHPADTTLGGTDDIVAFAVTETDGMTRFEAQIPLDSGDAYDKPLKPGETYPVIVAMGTSDAPTASHSYRGTGSITLSPAP